MKRCVNLFRDAYGDRMDDVQEAMCPECRLAKVLYWTGQGKLICPVCQHEWDTQSQAPSRDTDSSVDVGVNAGAGDTGR